jgi:hypothetical protein
MSNTENTTRYLIDHEGGEPEWLAGLADFRPGPAEIQVVGYGGWYNFSPELIASRNISIKEWWTADRRKAKSELGKKVHRNHDPAVNAKRSKSLKVSHGTDKHKAEASVRAKARWADPEYRAKQAAAVIAFRIRKGTAK